MCATHLYRRNRGGTSEHRSIATLHWVAGTVAARTKHAVHPQRSPIRRVINHNLLHVLIAAQRVQDGPHVLVNLQGLCQSRFTVKERDRRYVNKSPRDDPVRPHLLAQRTPPVAPFAVQLQVGLEVEACQMSTLVSSGGQGDALEGDRTLEAHIQRCRSSRAQRAVLTRQSTAVRIQRLILSARHQLLEMALNLGHTVLAHQHVPPQQSLQNVSHRWPVN